MLFQKLQFKEIKKRSIDSAKNKRKGNIQIKNNSESVFQFMYNCSLLLYTSYMLPNILKFYKQSSMKSFILKQRNNMHSKLILGELIHIRIEIRVL